MKNLMSTTLEELVADGHSEWDARDILAVMDGEGDAADTTGGVPEADGQKFNSGKADTAVLNVFTDGKQLGTLQLVGSAVVADPEILHDLVDSQLRRGAANEAEAFQRLDGWSNGYIWVTSRQSLRDPGPGGKYNPFHEPAGTSHGGRFAHDPGGGPEGGTPERPVYMDRPPPGGTAPSWRNQYESTTKGLLDKLQTFEPRPNNVLQLKGNVAKLTFDDGTSAVVKSAIHADEKAEYLASLIGNSLGLPVPPVVSVPSGLPVRPYGSTAMPFVEGLTGSQLVGATNAFYVSSAGLKVGVFDLVIGNEDRNSQNWIVVGATDSVDAAMRAEEYQIAPIDHELSFRRRTVFSSFSREIPPASLTDEDIQTIHDQLVSLKSEFVSSGRNSWFEQAMRNVEYLRQTYSGSAGSPRFARRSQKFNPHHDPHTGEFAPDDGGGGGGGPGSLSPPERDVVLKMTGEHPRSSGALVLQHGKIFNPMPGPPLDLPGGQLKQCYANSGRIALSHPDLTYVEGYVAVEGIPFPIQHAWNVDREGHVYDTTLEDGTAYVGVPLTTDFVLREQLRLGHFGPFVDYQWPYNDRPVPDGVIADVPGKKIPGQKFNVHHDHQGRFSSVDEGGQGRQSDYFIDSDHIPVLSGNEAKPYPTALVGLPDPEYAGGPPKGMKLGDKVSDDAFQALWAYRYDAHIYNSYLRGGDWKTLGHPSYAYGTIGHSDESWKNLFPAEAENLVSALQKTAVPLPQETTAFRVYNLSKVGDDLRSALFTEGSVISDKAFMSTSTASDIGGIWSSSSSSNLYVKMTVPEGTPAIWMNHQPQELLLMPNTSFRVDSVSKNENGNLVLEATVLKRA